MAGLVRCRRFVLLPQIFRNGARKQGISTSKNTKSDTAAVSDVAKCKSDAVIEAEKNWVSYGFETKNKKADRTSMALAMFTSVTMILVWGGLYFTYVPDYNLSDWAQRQAFIELRRRERAGLPLVDPNLIPVENITLPSDSELEGFEIVI